jgi:hypothetical protein
MTDVELVGTIVEEFRVKQIELRGAKALLIHCPRKDCESWFVVPRAWKKLRSFKRGDEKFYFITKPCPHCFKVSRLPVRWWPKGIAELYQAKADLNRDYFTSADIMNATGGGRSRR